jgi:hypothetical protein
MELALHKLLVSVASESVNDARIMEWRAIERWENEGGEIPNANIRSGVNFPKTKNLYNESEGLEPTALGRLLFNQHVNSVSKKI